MLVGPLLCFGTSDVGIGLRCRSSTISALAGRLCCGSHPHLATLVHHRSHVMGLDEGRTACIGGAQYLTANHSAFPDTRGQSVRPRILHDCPYCCFIISTATVGVLPSDVERSTASAGILVKKFRAVLQSSLYLLAVRKERGKTKIIQR